MDKHTFYTQTYSHTPPSEENRDKLIVNPYAQQRERNAFQTQQMFCQASERLVYQGP